MKQKTIDLLLDVKEGRKYTKRNDIWAPLSQAAIVELDTHQVKYGNNLETRIKTVRLTDWGEIVLKHEIANQKKKERAMSRKKEKERR